MPANVHDDLDRLVGALCDGTLTADEYARLDVLLADDEDARQYYNDYMFLHAELYSQNAAVSEIADCELRIADSTAANSIRNPKHAIRNRVYGGLRWRQR